MIPFDNTVALRQLELANKELLEKEAARSPSGESIALDGKFHPRILALVRPPITPFVWPAF
jgi:agmatinase